MQQAGVTLDVRKINSVTSIIDVQGDLTSAAESALMQALSLIHI